MRVCAAVRLLPLQPRQAGPVARCTLHAAAQAAQLSSQCMNTRTRSTQYAPHMHGRAHARAALRSPRAEGYASPGRDAPTGAHARPRICRPSLLSLGLFAMPMPAFRATPRHSADPIESDCKSALRCRAPPLRKHHSRGPGGRSLSRIPRSDRRAQNPTSGDRFAMASILRPTMRLLPGSAEF